MKRSITNKILLITTLALFIYASFSVSAMSLINFHTRADAIEGRVNIIAEEIENHGYDMEKVKALFSLPSLSQENRATLFTLDGDKIFDNKEPIFKEENILENKLFQQALLEGKSRAGTQVLSDGSTIITCYSQMTVSGERYVVRITAPFAETSDLYVLMIPIFLVVMVIVMLLIYVFTRHLVKNAVEPLNIIQHSLEDINRKNYHNININSNYREVQRIITELNTFSTMQINNANYLSYERQKSDFIIDVLPSGIIGLSSSMKIRLTNSAALNMFGATKNILGDSANSLFNDEALYNKISDHVSGNRSGMFVYNLKDKVYRTEIQTLPDDKTTNFVKCLVTFTDITDESNSSRIRSEFFANASHELKTPLTAIKGFSELMPASDDEEFRMKCAHEIEKNATRMMSLIQDMLKLSKMDAAVEEESYDIVEMRDIVDDVTAAVEPLLADKEVKVYVRGEGEVYGMRKQLEEVVTNLVDNAIKYNVKGGKVYVSLKDDGKHVILTVRDTGIGVEDANQTRLFERFFRVDKGRTRKVQSNGLGLSIVKHIVVKHGGYITLESRYGVGTTFTVYLPSLFGKDFKELGIVKTDRPKKTYKNSKISVKEFTDTSIYLADNDKVVETYIDEGLILRKHIENNR